MRHTSRTDETDPIYRLEQEMSGLPPGRILVAVSGGPDSVALLRALAGSGRKVAAGHVNHMLRGEESDADETFVIALGEQLGVPVFVGRVPTREESARRRASLEATARELRYAALWEMMDRWEGEYVATGHTLDDQAETVLLRLLRGSGTTGLTAMAAQRGRLLRPLLGVARETILRALAGWKQPFRVDSSNTDPEFLRNRVRLEVLPVLRALNPEITSILARTASLLRDDDDLIEHQVDEVLAALGAREEAGRVAVPRAVLTALHPALASRVSRRLIQRVSGDVWNVDAQHIAAVLGAARSGAPRRVQLPHNLRVDVDSRTVTFLTASSTPVYPLMSAHALDIPGTVETQMGTLSADFLGPATGDEVRRLVAVSGPFHALCDADAVGTRLLLRPRRPGDRIRPAGSGVTRKVQDVMVDAHVPREEREGVPIVTTENQIVWIPGLAVDERSVLTPETTRILHLTWRPNPSKIA